MMPVMMKPEPALEPHRQVTPPATASVPVAAPYQPTLMDDPQPETSNIDDCGLPAEVESRIDVESIKGVFGWATVDGVNIPYIIRKYKKFVSVRIVEKKLLSRYPNAFPDELAKKDPLVSFFVTEYEAKLLDEINTIHCSYEYGTQAFTTKELIVDLVEFEDFYNLVKKTFPEDVLAKLRSNDQPSETKPSSSISRDILEKMCSWIQINNTVTPVIKRNQYTFVPLSVIKYAAGLLTNVQLDGVQPSPDDCALLNETCKIAGFDFQFGKSTKLIELAEIARHCQPTILQLPFDDPLKHARYLDTPSPSPSAQPQSVSPSLNQHGSPPGPTAIPSPQMPNQQFSYQRSNVPVNPFAMMQMMARSLVPQQLAYSQPGLMPNSMSNAAMMQRLPFNPQRPPSGGNPSHPSQQMSSGKPPPYPHGYNPNTHPSSHPSNARVNFPQDQIHLQKGPPVSHFQQYTRHAMSERFPPNQSYPYPGSNPRGMPPVPSYQPPMSTARTGINSNAGNNIPQTSASSAGSVPATVAARQPPRPIEVPKSSAQPVSSVTCSKLNTSNHLKIEGVVLNGKSISCLNLNSPIRQGKFCLVEAVCKLYFSQININEFLYVLQNVLKVPLYSCMDDEEKAFIQYYNLPVNVLKCNKMVSLSDLDSFFPQMTYIINQKFSDKSSSSSNKKEAQTNSDDERQSSAVQAERVTNSRKRHSSGQGGPESKQSCNLEQIMQRLAQKNQIPDDNSANAAPSVVAAKFSNNVIVLDD